MLPFENVLDPGVAINRTPGSISNRAWHPFSDGMCRRAHGGKGVVWHVGAVLDMENSCTLAFIHTSTTAIPTTLRVCSSYDDHEGGT